MTMGAVLKTIEISSEKSKDENEKLIYGAWLHGMYVAHAISATVGNMFSKNSHNEYPKNPLEDIQVKKDELSEEEKLRQTKLLFARLEMMQANFELEKKKKQNKEKGSEE